MSIHRAHVGLPVWRHDYTSKTPKTPIHINQTMRVNLQMRNRLENCCCAMWRKQPRHRRHCLQRCQRSADTAAKRTSCAIRELSLGSLKANWSPFSPSRRGNQTKRIRSLSKLAATNFYNNRQPCPLAKRPNMTRMHALWEDLMPSCGSGRPQNSPRRLAHVSLFLLTDEYTTQSALQNCTSFAGGKHNWPRLLQWRDVGPRLTWSIYS